MFCAAEAKGFGAGWELELAGGAVDVVAPNWNGLLLEVDWLKMFPESGLLKDAKRLEPDEGMAFEADCAKRLLDAGGGCF